ncbi:MAG: histidinol-phosphate transaminase [Planctomycetota bacterium]|nr:histidinol-phosphate transaminase [Planctomycetota bacterium]
MSYFQNHIDAMTGYVPGEQPRDRTFIKLNTNENPYSPSQKVAEAMMPILLDGRLRLYPDPLATEFRQAAAELHGVEPSWIMSGNGSDDILTILTRAFAGPGDVIASAQPGYILYETLAELQNSRFQVIPFPVNWKIGPEHVSGLKSPKIFYLANPNSPSGTVMTPGEVGELADALPCPLVVDEAYGDFATTNCISLVKSHSNVIVTRTFSKGYSLAGLRIGYCVARPELIQGLNKVKDSYNCDMLSLAGATAALKDQDWLIATRQKIWDTRSRLAAGAAELGYLIPESHANFIWCEGGPPAREVYAALRDRDILVRLMSYPGREPALRITVGTDHQIDLLLKALGEIV